MSLEGIDVAVHQGSVDWNKVAGAVDFAFVKATEGQDFVDETFTRKRIEALQRTDLFFSAYSFAWPSDPVKTDAVKECNDFLAACKSRGLDLLRGRSARQKRVLPGVLDIEARRENVDRYEAQRWIRKWVRHYRERCGHRPIIYTGSFWRDFLGNPIIMARCKLWLAAYVKDPKPYTPRAWKRITFWQWTSSGRVPGVSGAVDRNRFFGDREALKRLTI